MVVGGLKSVELETARMDVKGLHIPDYAQNNAQIMPKYVPTTLPIAYSASGVFKLKRLKYGIVFL